MNDNYLIVIENGQLTTYPLNDRIMWSIGRPSNGNMPDIRFYSSTVSRRHGELKNMDGIWFYLDFNGKNGTIYNGKHINAGRNGKIKPVMLNSGDVLIFGGGDTAVINYKTVWAMFYTGKLEGQWCTIETDMYSRIMIKSDNVAIEVTKADKGRVLKSEKGIAIYMGELMFVFGDVKWIGQ